MPQLVTRACVCVLAVVALVRLGPTTADLAERATRDRLPSERATAGGAAAGADVKFVEWARRRVPAGARYWVSSADARVDAAFYQWLTYRLLPLRQSSGPAGADALIFHGERAPAGLRRGWRLYRYEDGSAIAIRRRAG